MSATWIGFIAGLLTSVASLPQVLKTWRSRHAQDLSIWQPLLLSIGVALWLFYGILIQDIPLILANITPLVCNLLLTGMKIRYDRSNNKHHNQKTTRRTTT